MRIAVIALPRLVSTLPLAALPDPVVDQARSLMKLYRAHYWLGVTYEKQGKNAEARGQFQAALHLRPADNDAKQALRRGS